MSLLNFTIFLICFLHLKVNSQNNQSVIVQYELVSTMIEAKGNTISNQNTNALSKELFKIQENFIFTLKANKKSVVFSNNFTGLDDDSENLKIKISNSIFGFDSFEYKKAKDSLFFIKGNYKVYKKNIINWEITDSIKYIDKYRCIYAKGTYIGKSRGKSYKFSCSAWFTPEISFNYGPDGITNLPGLVLEYENGRKKIVARKIEFLEDELKLDFKNYKILTEEQYNNSMPYKP